MRNIQEGSIKMQKIVPMCDGFLRGCFVLNFNKSFLMKLAIESLFLENTYIKFSLK